MRDGRSAPPEAAREAGRDLQKEFDQLLRGQNGTERALEFLAANKERNPQYAERRALKVLSKVVMGAESLASKLRGAHMLASARELQADLYAQYRELSERQRTKRSFRDFVEEAISEIGEGGEEEREFWDVVFEDLDARKDYRQHGEMSGTYATIRTRLPHYRKLADQDKENMRRLQAIGGKIREILAVSEHA